MKGNGSKESLMGKANTSIRKALNSSDLSFMVKKQEKERFSPKKGSSIKEKSRKG